MDNVRVRWNRVRWNRPRPGRMTTAVLIAVALVSGCGGNSEDAGRRTAESPVSGSPSGPAAQPGDPAAIEGGSPLSAYFPGWNGAGQEVLTATQRAEGTAKLMRVQQLIADCMAKEGFTYTPWLSPMNSGAIPNDLPTLGTMEYAQKYGLGIAENPLQEALDQLPPAVDPHETYKNGLSPSERYAYNVALLGKNAADVEKGAEDGTPVSKNASPPPDDGGGCRRAANQTVFPDDEQDEAARALYAAAKRAVSNIDGDPRVVDALRGWSDCMVSEGHPRFARRVDVQNLYMSESVSLDRSDSSALSAFAAREVKAAVDDLSCADSAGYTQLYNEVRDEIERKFIADHQAELDAYVAKYGNR